MPADGVSEVFQLEPAALRDEARRLARPRGSAEHWSRLAAVLGRIDDERLYTAWGGADGPRTMRQYAAEELGLPGDEVVGLLKLWKMMKGSEPKVPLSAWASVPRNRAATIRRVVDAGGDPAAWIEKSRGMTALAFENSARVATGGEPAWVRVEIRMPDSVAQLLTAAMVKALAAVDPTVGPDRVHDRDVAFRCVEAVAADYINRGAA